MHVSPLEVIRAWFVASHTLNDAFQSLPEANEFQWVVHPACCDAEVDLMWCNMMDTVVPLG